MIVDNFDLIPRTKKMKKNSIKNQFLASLIVSIQLFQLNAHAVPAQSETEREAIGRANFIQDILDRKDPKEMENEVLILEDTLNTWKERILISKAELILALEKFDQLSGLVDANRAQKIYLGYGLFGVIEAGITLKSFYESVKNISDVNKLRKTIDEQTKNEVGSKISEVLKKEKRNDLNLIKSYKYGVISLAAYVAGVFAYYRFTEPVELTLTRSEVVKLKNYIEASEKMVDRLYFDLRLLKQTIQSQRAINALE